MPILHGHDLFLNGIGAGHRHHCDRGFEIEGAVDDEFVGCVRSIHRSTLR